MEKEKPFPEVSRTTISYAFREGGSILMSLAHAPAPSALLPRAAQRAPVNTAVPPPEKETSNHTPFLKPHLPSYSAPPDRKKHSYKQIGTPSPPSPLPPPSCRPNATRDKTYHDTGHVCQHHHSQIQEAKADSYPGTYLHPRSGQTCPSPPLSIFMSVLTWIGRCPCQHAHRGASQATDFAASLHCVSSLGLVSGASMLEIGLEKTKHV